MKLSEPARELVSVIRRHRLNYDTFSKAAYQARRHLSIKPPRRGRQLPKILPDSSLRAYFNAITRGGNMQHEILLKLLFYTGVRVSELSKIKVSDVDLTANKIFIESGKGDKDRYILFPDSFRLVLRSFVWSHPEQTYLFESRQKRHYSTRRIQQIVEEYAVQAGIEERVHPHLFRHQLLSFLTREGLTDSQIQLISGHSNKKALEVYQHVSLKDISDDYQEAMRKVEI